MAQRHLFICDTPFQIMMALAFRMTILRGEYVEIIISDIITNSEGLFQNIKESRVFDRVYYYRDYELNYGKKSKQKLLILKEICKRKRIVEDKLSLEGKYDAFYTTDTLRSIDWLYEILILRNPSMEMFYYEEGPISVLSDQGNHFKRSEEYENCFKRLVNKIVGIKHINGNFQGAFTTMYEQMPGKYFEWYDMPRIPPKKLSSYVDKLNDFWNYKCTNEFSNKFIFLEESFFADGRENRDVEIIKDIVSVVGKDNVIVKLHPRTRENRFEKMGLNVYRKTNVPWELIALNGDLEKTVLICVGSGAILYPKLYWNINQISIALLECKDYHYEYLDSQYYKTFAYICKKKELALLPQRKEEFIRNIKAYRERYIV